MIVTGKENKPTSLLDLLGGNSKNKDSKIGNTFAQLLSTLGDSKKGEKSGKETDFTAIIDPKKSPNLDSKAVDPKNLKAKAFEELLMGKTEESDLFSKELIHVLSTDQVQSLIHKAKTYLKQEIMKSQQYDQHEHKDIPKTLMGLVELADKIGIKLNEITLSTIDSESENLLKELPTPLRSKPILDLLTAKETETPTKPFEAIMQILKEVKPAEVVSTDPTRKEAGKFADKEAPLQALLKGLDTTEAITSKENALKEVVKETPKAPVAPVHFEALSALLSGESTADTPAQERGKEFKVELEPTKTPHQPHKIDSLEVKAKEAVQSMRHFAQDMKEAVENYKPPFTRITMKLNPERLGEVDVTLIQRGNNVHVNIQSQNANSIAFLAHNASELKAQLAHNGITNATMNFMSGGNGEQQHNPQQQQQEQNRFRAYQSFEELELNQEELSALELIIPHYA